MAQVPWGNRWMISIEKRSIQAGSVLYLAAT